MRVMIAGTTGYIGNRLVGALLGAGHAVVAGARSLRDLDGFWWGDRVERTPFDALDAESVSSALSPGVDALVYLVHGMADKGFVEADAAAARNVRDAVDEHGVGRVAYLSGIIPDVPEAELSDHLRSRLAVERELSRSSAAVTTLRAAMIIGANSTSFELMRQLGDRLPITVIPGWMRRSVDPVPVDLVLSALVAAVENGDRTLHVDVGGGSPLPYPDLIARVAEAQGRSPRQLSVPLLPEGLVAAASGLLSDVPAATVTALMESLHHDMTASGPSPAEALGARTRTADLDDDIRRSLAAPDYARRPSERDVLGPLPGDPPWSQHTGG